MSEWHQIEKAPEDKPFLAWVKNHDGESFRKLGLEHSLWPDGMSQLYNDEIEGFECMECLHKVWLDKGMENFKSADFFDYSDLSDNGFEIFNSYFCSSERSYRIVKEQFIELQETNYVIANIDSSGHIEHHISLYVKKKE